VEELQPDEVEPWFAAYDPALVHRLFPLEDGEVDLREAGMVHRAPHDVRHLEDPTVFKPAICSSVRARSSYFGANCAILWE